ncbi:hypothetical protein [Bradyrhizobium sp. Ec3.3]|uniref:hypothetical protein n=1 Tax=Bradyrhizobium sp. Ec3.3 TaxID=189753 RepID=UPI00041BBCCF|nr:hypothetical protein [Bradyrhizobium sp. Ec3.3]
MNDRDREAITIIEEGKSSALRAPTRFLRKRRIPPFPVCAGSLSARATRGLPTDTWFSTC